MRSTERLTGTAPPTRIVVFESRSLDTGDVTLEELAVLGQVTFREDKLQPDVGDRERDAEIIVINKSLVSREALAQLPQLRLISVTATGYDCVDLDATRQAGVLVCNVPEYGTEAVAEHVFALLLAYCRRVEWHDALVRQGQWQRHGEFSFWDTPQQELSGRTMGIVGWGRIGRRVAAMARAWGMKLLAHTREPPVRSRPAARFVDLQTLASSADVISLHCPLTDVTRGMVNAELLQRMKPTSILINTARGGLVDEQALAQALHDGVIAAALLDTVSVEPMTSDNPLWSAPRCLLTPHLAWATRSARLRLVAETAGNIRAYLAGRPRHRVG